MGLAGRVGLTSDQRTELAALVNSADAPASVATRARIVLWRADGRPKVEVAALAGVSRPTVDQWLSRFAASGVAGLLDRRRGAPREQVSAAVRGRVLALTGTSPPAETGLSHWSSREPAAFINRTEGVSVSHHYVAKLWRETGWKPQRQGTFKLSKDPEFAAKVVDVVGLNLEPPGGAVVLSIDDNLATHTTPEVTAWLARNPHVHVHFTPVGSSWINQIETWFGIITRQSIRRGTVTSVTVLVKQIRDYIDHWNANSKPFVWMATADDILAKVQLVQTSIKKLVDNNAK
jgi:transposase